MTTQLIRIGATALSVMRLPRVITRREKGVALFVGLVFLVILSLVALVAMRGTLLDMRMTTATARHEQTFEASEAAREIPELMIKSHVAARGWPKSWGGNISDAMFDLNTVFANRLAWKNLLNPNTTAGNGLQISPCTGALVSFIAAVTCPLRTAAYNYTPSSWEAAAIFTTCGNGSTGSGTSCPASQQITSTVSIIRDGVSIIKGNASGIGLYGGVGVSAANGGSKLQLQVRSESKGLGGDATTIAQYQLSITN